MSSSSRSSTPSSGTFGSIIGERSKSPLISPKAEIAQEAPRILILTSLS